jgi:hypothetical protein
MSFFTPTIPTIPLIGQLIRLLVQEEYLRQNVLRLLSWDLIRAKQAQLNYTVILAGMAQCLIIPAIAHIM